MDWYTNKMLIEDILVVGGLILVQIVYAANPLFLQYLMSLGISSLTIVIFSTFATFLILSPFAVHFERSKWPKKLSLTLIIQLLFISFAGVTLFQSLFLKGLQLTSPALATAMPNIAPALIFAIAWAVRLEKVDVRCIYSKVKIIGTLLCVVGAVTMSLMTSAAARPITKIHRMTPPPFHLDRNKIIGCAYLMGSVFVLASNIVLQAAALAHFPAPMSLGAATSLIGVIITVFVQFYQNHTMVIDWPLASFKVLIAYSLLGGAVSGACFSFNGWAMKKRGPVLVSLFNPISTVVSVLFSVITLGDKTNLGSVGGMCLMFTGLYFVLWAKGKERHPDVENGDFNEKKPLLKVVETWTNKNDTSVKVN